MPEIRWLRLCASVTVGVSEMVKIIRSTQLDGNPFEPNGFDMFAQVGLLSTSESVPDGWKVMTGNHMQSVVARIVYRHEIDGV